MAAQACTATAGQSGIDGYRSTSVGPPTDARIVRRRCHRASRAPRRHVRRHLAVPGRRRRVQVRRSTDKSVGGPTGPIGPSAPFAPFEPHAPFARFCARRRRQRARGEAAPGRSVAAATTTDGPTLPGTHLRTVLKRLLDDGSRRKQRQTASTIATMKYYFPCSRRLIIIFSQLEDAPTGAAWPGRAAGARARSRRGWL